MADEPNNPTPPAEGAPNPAPAADAGAGDNNPAPAAEPALLDDAGDGDGTPPAATPGAWPETWRDMMGDGNDKLKNVLARFSSPKAVAEALLATRQKLSSGDYKKGLGENPTPEELAVYRKENGIPDKAEDYDVTLDGGLVLGDDQKPYIDGFLQQMHAINAPQGFVKQALAAYAQNVQQAQEQQFERDEQHRVESEDKLRSEWGNEYRANLNGATALLDTLPEGFKTALLTARDGEGNLLRTNPEVVRTLSQLATQLNPVATVMPGSGSNAQQAMETEIETIQKEMGNQHSEYWRGPKDAQGRTKMQARYQQLLEAKERAR